MKLLPVGMMNYPDIRTQDFYYVDKTMYLEKLERVGPFLMFLRPRRFGKTLFASMMKSYYDLNNRERFEQLFGGLYAGAHPTPLRNSFLILSFDFSCVTADSDLKKVQAAFQRHCTNRCLDFLKSYSRFFPADFAEEVSAIPTPGEQLERISKVASYTNQRIYVFIDEYDNFVNTILAQPAVGHDRFTQLTHDEGFFRNFFTLLKGAANTNYCGLSRIYLTGVTPIALNNITSGFNIATNISMDSDFNAMNGFTLDEVQEMLAYYQKACGYNDPPEKHIEAMKTWYNNYCFSKDAIGKYVFNTDMVLNYINQYVSTGKQPDSLLDNNARTDFGKLRHLIQLEHDLRKTVEQPDESLLLKLAHSGETITTIRDSFTLDELTRPELFKSFLFYLGILSLDRIKYGMSVLRIPNLTVLKQVFGYISDEMHSAKRFTVNLDELGTLTWNMAYNGKWEPALEYMAEQVHTQLGIRDFIYKEKGPQLLHCIYLGLPAVFRVEHEREHEREHNMEYNDLALIPDFATCPGAKFSYLLEFKYISADKRYDSREKALLDKLLAEATKELIIYRADELLQSMLGRTKLLSIAVVYRGAKLLKMQLVP